MESIRYSRSEDAGKEGFAARLEHIIGRQSIRKFALACGISEGTLRSYLKGDTFPTIDKISDLATAGKVSQEWLLFGDEINDPSATYARVPVLNYDLLLEVLLAVDKGMAQLKLDLPAEKKAKLITLLYDYFTNRQEPVDMTNVIRFIDIAK